MLSYNILKLSYNILQALRVFGINAFECQKNPNGSKCNVGGNEDCLHLVMKHGQVWKCSLLTLVPHLLIIQSNIVPRSLRYVEVY